MRRYNETRSEFISPDNPKYGAYPVQYKTLSHPMSDPNFLSICANTSTKACFGHIRAAPSSKSRPIPTLSPTNCHPFCKGQYSFMHNGGVADFDKMRREVTSLMGDDEAAWVKGNTDSEALAAVFYTHLGEETRLGPQAVQGPIDDVALLKRVLERTITDVLRTQKEVLKKSNQTNVEPSSLNLAVTDGRVLICCRLAQCPQSFNIYSLITLIQLPKPSRRATAQSILFYHRRPNPQQKISRSPRWRTSYIHRHSNSART